MEVLLTRSSSHHTVNISRDRGLLKCQSRYMALTGWDFTDAQAWVYMYFLMFAPTVRLGTEACKPYILQYPMLDSKNESKLLDIRLRLDLMTADEVRWTLYRTQENRASWVSTWHGFIAYFDLYSHSPYPISGGTQASKQQDVRVEEYFCGGTVA
ncbi:hypothetical protein M9H77_10984 [Catharanthus roseus]|uniref:Uncharacterized protein n=1 Tax=Catharanthus roseus TaxID=4058 RepID=A0ACC0BDB0_CATRO|nr:hypothetical protein M9H77_10984 [Catharanthus roseus]